MGISARYSLFVLVLSLRKKRYMCVRVFGLQFSFDWCQADVPRPTSFVCAAGQASRDVAAVRGRASAFERGNTSALR